MVNEDTFKGSSSAIFMYDALLTGGPMVGLGDGAG